MWSYIIGCHENLARDREVGRAFRLTCTGRDFWDKVGHEHRLFMTRCGAGGRGRPCLTHLLPRPAIYITTLIAVGTRQV